MNPSSSSNRKKKQWREEKERLLKMTLEERRKAYVRDVVPLNDIMSWREEMRSKSHGEGKLEASEKCPIKAAEDNLEEPVPTKRSLSQKVSLYRGDITLLEIDAIVNAANSSLLGGGGVDGCIHRAAGACLLAECRSLSGCETGEAKITCGYDLPAKYVIHTVGPIARGHINETHREDLANCYRSSLKLAKENSIRSVAFPCISTGIYGFPNEPAAQIALDTIKEWLRENHSEMDRVIFCVFLETDFKIYKQKLAEAFPLDDDDEDASEETEPLDPKARSSPSKKCKERFPDNSKDESDGDSGTDEKEPTEEKEREAGKEDREVKDGTEKELTEVNYGPEEKTDTEEMEGQSQGKEPSKDSIDIYEDAEFQSVDEHEQTEGHQGEDNMKHEMTALPDSQISFVDTEELSSICEEEAENEQLSRAGGMDDEGSSLEKGQTSCDHFEYIDADADINEDEDDAEMNIPLEIAVEAPESHPQEQLMEAHDEKTGN